MQTATLFSEQSIECFVFTWFCIYMYFYGCKLSTIYQQVFKEPIKVVHLQELANQWRFNGALVIEKINNSFWRSNTKFGRMKKEKRSNKIKEIWEVKIHAQNSKVTYAKIKFPQAVSSCGICCNNVQSKQDFGKWKYFQSSLSLGELQRIRDVLLFVR